MGATLLAFACGCKRRAVQVRRRERDAVVAEVGAG
jgi:hypothetical protein